MKEGKTMHLLYPREPHLEKMSKTDCSGFFFFFFFFVIMYSLF